VKVAVLTWQYPPIRAGGTEIATQKLARHLSQCGHAVVVITTRDAGLPIRSNEAGVAVYRVRSLRPKALKYLWFCFNVTVLVWQHRPDVIHAQALWTSLPALVCARILRRPYVIWVQGADVYYPRFLKGPLGRIGLANAAAVLAPTHHMKEAVSGMCGRDILVIPYGVDLHSSSPLGRSDACARLGIPSYAKVVLFVGSLIPVKGVRFLVEAMRDVVDRHTAARLLIVGSGPDEDMLRGLVDQFGLSENVWFVGRVPNEAVPLYMAAADVFVLPSLSEGLPLVILEAMAAGLPIVVSDVTGMSEVIASGENGFTVPAGDPKGIAVACIELLSNSSLRTQMAAVNRRTAQNYSWTAVVQRLLRTYTAVQQTTAKQKRRKR